MAERIPYTGLLRGLHEGVHVANLSSIPEHIPNDGLGLSLLKGMPNTMYIKRKT